MSMSLALSICILFFFTYTIGKWSATFTYYIFLLFETSTAVVPVFGISIIPLTSIYASL